MKILLDLDQTIIMRGAPHTMLGNFLKFVKDNNHEVVIWSSSEDIRFIAYVMGFDWISKGDDIIPQADVLIDDYANAFCILCSVDKSFTSLQAFMDWVGKSQ